MILTIILSIIILATSWPVSLLLSWLCADELVKDKKYFVALSYFLLGLGIIISLFYFNSVIIFSLVYMILVLALMILKSRDIKFVKKYQ